VSIADDLRKLVSASATVLEGLGHLEKAADAIAAQAGPVVEQWRHPKPGSAPRWPA
jgi:hypothetical protein